MDYDPPFWVDDPNPYIPLPQNPNNLADRLAVWMAWCGVIWRLGLALFLVILAFQYPWLGIVSAYLVWMAAIRFLVMRRKNNLNSRAAETQQLAKERTGALTIGNVIHTAGHPLLEINQPVVLALKKDSLSIHSYQHVTPLDTILLKDIQAVELVTYDGEGVPHAGVVDSTAQALQLHFLIRGRPCTCLFRRMYKVRAVGWYQALQVARLA